MDLAKLQSQLAEQQGKIPPVEKWQPDFCGDIDIQIKHDGSWFYMGTPIGRKPLVKLFASVLRKDEDEYFLVTPVEKVRIQVEDVPFIITQWNKQDELLTFTTQTDDTFVVSNDNPVEIRQDGSTKAMLPYVRVRRNLWARLHQNVYYQLIEIAKEVTTDNQRSLQLKSGTYTFSLGSF
ncbi:DUF1285 domain-containing protein [Aliiglaciecola lipolytica]|uniref:DUF1285 domain-containing protein n=1 Tax=Aliiglaciecola lipolytica E3 TaxID=1127673 RepID=K6YDJ1_9ALTE|nr:DUF1285 domain-containing protein [Aliiglaciecola lipolytica]GAC16262.1 hypothetical protein GLIP_3651 [Aliiglaciecola lipolytica E3]